MKLLTKYNRLNIISAIIALLVSSVCYYFFIRYELILQLDKDLEIEELEIMDYVKMHDSLPAASSYKDQLISFQKINDERVKRRFSSKDVFSNDQNEWQRVREIIFPVHAGYNNYKVMISKSQRETDDLIRLILLISSGIAMALLLAIFIINRFILKKLWRPFNITLQQLQQFNLTGKKELELQESSIYEFAELNNAVTVMSNKVILDYEALKSFTENASHELQTPLAIIQSKLELLMQSNNLQEEQLRDIHFMQEACTRLSKLNHSLILLTKIDNRQFHEKEIINAGDILERQLKNYEELIAVKKITVAATIDEECKLAMNETMVEILFSNLVTNAIKHNIPNGKITLELTPKKLVIINTGNELKTDSTELFGRFKKDNNDTTSLGLGLSIVKKICEQNEYLIEYTYKDGLHSVTVCF